MSAARKLAALSPAARDAALAALDEISRPMTKIEIEDAIGRELPRSVRRPAARTLAASFDIIVVNRRRDD